MNLREKLEKELAKCIELRKVFLNNESNEIEGRLELSPKNNKHIYYHVTKDKEKGYKRKYIKKSQIDLATSLAQKSYNKRMIDLLNKNIEAISVLLEIDFSRGIQAVYDGLEEGRKVLVNRLYPSCEEKMLKWKSRDYEKNPMEYKQVGLYSKKGDRVRSKSEKILSDKFYDLGIDYKYECPLYFEDGRKIYPDFTFYRPDFDEELYWEHFGMMDKPEYAINAINKMELYQAHGIMVGERLIVSFESSKSIFNDQLINILIDRYLLI